MKDNLNIDGIKIGDHVKLTPKKDDNCTIGKICKDNNLSYYIGKVIGIRRFSCGFIVAIECSNNKYGYCVGAHLNLGEFDQEFAKNPKNNFFYASYSSLEDIEIVNENISGINSNEERGGLSYL